MTGIIGALAVAWLLAYGVRAFRRVYGGTTARAVLRVAVVLGVYLVAMAVTIGTIAAPIVRQLFF